MYNYDSLNPSRPGDIKEAYNVETFCNDIVSIFTVYTVTVYTVTIRRSIESV